MRARRQRLAAALLGLLAALGGGCRAAPAPESADVAARVADHDVPYARFDRYVRAQIGEPVGGLDSQVLSGLFDQFLREELLTRLAVDEGRVPADSGHRAAVEALLADANVNIPPAAIQEWYESHRAELVLPERLRLRHIFVPTREAAEEARRRVEAGEDFAAVARAVSADPSAEAGGDQGELALDDLPAAFAAHVAPLAAGTVGEPLQANDGWHLFQVVQRLPARERTLAEVAPEIEERLRQRQGDELLERRLAEAADRYNVVVYGQNLPFEYRGEHSRRAVGDPS